METHSDRSPGIQSPFSSRVTSVIHDSALNTIHFGAPISTFAQAITSGKTAWAPSSGIWTPRQLAPSSVQ